VNNMLQFERGYGLIVSILVLMELPRELYIPFFKPRIHRVSILVLMELPREQQSGVLKKQNSVRFNPCFNGIAS